MSKLTPWTIKHLLPLLKETVSPLLPFYLKEGEGLSLSWRGQPVASFSPGEKISAEEWRRWGPAATALINEVFERLVREKTIDGLPGPDLLFRELEKKPLKGLLLKTSKPPAREGLYVLKDGLFFLPEEYFDFRGLLKDLWRKGKVFRAAALFLETPEEVESLVQFVSFFDAFGFVWFTGKAARYFTTYGLDEEKWPALQELATLGPSHTLVWVEGEPPSLNCLREKATFWLELGEERALFATNSPPDSLKELLTSLSLRAGVLPPGDEKRPLRLLWAAFEHARRLGEEAIIFWVPFSLHVLGDVFLDLGDIFAALSCYEEVLGRSLQPVELFNSLAYVYLELGDHQRAEAFLQKAFSEAPADPMLAYNLALFLEREGREEEALPLFEKAYLLAQEEGPFALALAERLARKGQWERIKEILTSRRTPLSSQEAFWLARAHYESGELEEALELFKQVTRKDPKNLEALGYLALLYIQLRGEYSIAEAALPQLEKSPSLAKLVGYLKTFMTEVKS